MNRTASNLHYSFFFSQKKLVCRRLSSYIKCYAKLIKKWLVVLALISCWSRSIIKTRKINRFRRFKFLIWSIKDTFTSTSYACAPLIVSLVRRTLLFLYVHGLWEFHLLITIPLGYSSVRIRSVALLGFGSFNHWKQILFVLRIHGLSIYRKQAFNKSWL